MRLRIGANWPYDALPQAPESTWSLFRALNPESVVIMSHAAAADYERLAQEFPGLEVNIRQKLGPTHQVVPPGDVLNYREWPTEHSLGDALEQRALAGLLERTSVIYLNEPDIELAAEPVDNATNMNQAINAYLDAYWTAQREIRAAFPGVKIAAAPLSQGSPVRFSIWANAMDHLYLNADVIAEHCYFPTWPRDPDWGGRYLWFRARYPEKPIRLLEVNDNGTGASLRQWQEYISSVAESGEVEELDVFTLPGGMRDAEAPGWWFLDDALALAVAAVERTPAPPIIVDPIEQEAHVPEFVLGFKDKAEELGPDIVGQPLEDQDYLPLAGGGEMAFQTTSTGLMVYSKKANQVHFLPGARR